MERTTTEQGIPSTKPAHTIRFITYGAFFAFFLFGFIDNIKGPTLPALLSDLNFSYAQGGTIVFGAYMGFLVATLLTGPLSDIAGKKAVIFVCCLCFFVGISAYAAFHTFWLLTLAMTAIGLGLGSVEVGANLIVVDLYHQEKGKYLNLLAFFHGVGSMVAPLYAGRMLAAGMSWQQVYQFSLPLVIALFLYFLFVKYPRTASSESNSLDLKKIGKSVFTGEMLLFYIAIALYVGAEIGIGAWLVEFLQKTKSQSVMRSSFYLSLFFGGITLGRFVGSFLVGKIGYLKILFITSVASSICLAIGTFGPPALAFFIPLAGLFFAIVFPTITAAVSELHQENVGTILGILFAFAGVGGALGPWLVGVMTDYHGLYIGFGMNALFCIIMSLMFMLLLKHIQKTT